MTTQVNSGVKAPGGEIAIELEAPRGPGGLRRRVFVVLDRDAQVIAAVDDGGNGWAALPLAGFGECPRSPMFHATIGEYERYLRLWGPTSRGAILRKARAICESRSISLDATAIGVCFEAEGDELEFLAALWHVWAEQPEPIMAQSATGFVGQFGPYLLLERSDGRIALEEQESDEEASRRLSELTAVPA
ncbi:MAG TPA: hypothetical protein VG518_10520 [Solirubrobacterales bacterium]|nr:hypothetical protein [Solirubrobacterales bacterium]